jgi:hypothetical protein
VPDLRGGDEMTWKLAAWLVPYVLAWTAFSVGATLAVA